MGKLIVSYMPNCPQKLQYQIWKDTETDGSVSSISYPWNGGARARFVDGQSMLHIGGWMLKSSKNVFHQPLHEVTNDQMSAMSQAIWDENKPMMQEMKAGLEKLGKKK